MNAAVVARSVAERRRAAIGYAIGLGLMIVWVVLLYPSVEQEMADYVDAMPEAMKSLFGMEDLTSLAGFVHAEIFSLMGPIVFLALAVTTGVGAVAGEERERILPLILATGFGRGRLLVSRWIALAIDMLALGVVTLVSLLGAAAAAGGGIGVGGAVLGTVRLSLLGLLFGTLALGAGAATGRKTLASGLTVGLALAAYLLDALANLVEWLEPAEVISPFHWYAPGNPLVAGAAPGGLLLLLTATAMALGLGARLFDRRDVGV